MNVFLSGKTEVEREFLRSLASSRNHVAVGVHSTAKCSDVICPEDDDCSFVSY